MSPSLAKVGAAVAVLALYAPNVRAQAKQHFRLWEALVPGHYAVGYRSELLVDSSRTWRVTRSYARPFSPDSLGRPIRLSVWYPARPQPAARRMVFGEYSRTAAPPAFADYIDALRLRDSVIVTLTVQPREVTELNRLEVDAVRDAPAAVGRFPVVLLLGGLNAETTAQSVLAEYLASNGYVVATVPWTGLDENHPDATRDQQGLEAVTRDLEFAWAKLRATRDVSPVRVAVVGHSLGGLIAPIEAMRNGDVSAAIGLDATYGFEGAASVLTSFYGYAPRRMTAAVLDLRKAAGEQNTVLDLSALHAWYYADRSFVTLRHIRHSEFTTYSLISDAFHEPPIPAQFQTAGWTRETAARAYVAACRIVKDFLDAKLRGDSLAGMQRVATDIAASTGAVFSHEGALRPPPSAPELVQISRARGVSAALAIVERYHHDAPGDVILREGEMNSLGYQYIGKRRFPEALTAFRLLVQAYPKSANAYDSYGDGLLASADTSAAVAAYRRVLELAPLDSTLDASSRDDLEKNERERIRTLTAGPAH
jgi:dienelactone hydrolase